MRICLDIRSKSGAGLPVIIQNLVPRILEHGRAHDFTILCHPDQETPYEGIEIWTTPGSNPLGELLWVQTRLPGRLRRERIEVYHSLKHLGPLRAPCASILSLNEVGQYLEPRTLPIGEHLYWSYLEPLALKRADHVVAISRWCRDVLVDRFHLDRGRISVVPCGIDPVFHEPADPDAAELLRQRLRLPSRYLLAVGNINPKKNFTTIVKAMARLDAEGFEAPDLVIVGGIGYRAEKLTRPIAALGLEERVHCTGFLSSPELAHLYRGASALVYPSLYESFGIPPIEAMACGVPVITTDRGAIPEVTGGHAWFLDDPTDAGRLAGLIREALRPSPEKEERVRKGREWARRYSWETAAETIVAIYERVGGLPPR